jgi:hypothetical protein
MVFEYYWRAIYIIPVGAGSPTIIAPKLTISKTRPHPTNNINVHSDLRWGGGGFILIVGDYYVWLANPPLQIKCRLKLQFQSTDRYCRVRRTRQSAIKIKNIAATHPTR